MAKKKKKNPSKRVVKIAPERPEARDEGPRLIPLDIKPPHNQFGRRALELADVALGLIPPRPPKRPKKKP